ncbi:NUDIX hydrolase [Jeotgalibacillus terrae]|uniref:NUDIX domain-containing protein n=1 Tax=Jeotgalibacillus terrae TaxID=587735 RepID=A0ABW5ZGG4_9BACL|nr:NUDIX domain-containing protein [Jeotgalibacillus terrae]MBM7580396.1 8-oxo-dGTP pyrophosphatase MutT (NUDIX family) [Jeotgalibacillus terrae]
MEQSPIVKQKVLAYITRENAGKTELLVFSQKERPQAGLQVPGGGVEDDELLIDALYREIEEETGLKRDELQLQGKLHKHMYYSEDRSRYYERNFFHLALKRPVENEWEYTVESNGKDDGFKFQFEWRPLEDASKLAADMDNAVEWLNEV